MKGLEIPAPTVPEGFRVLMRELNSLGLDVVPHEIEEEVLIEEPEEVTPEELAELEANSADVEDEDTDELADETEEIPEVDADLDLEEDTEEGDEA